MRKKRRRRKWSYILGRKQEHHFFSPCITIEPFSPCLSFPKCGLTFIFEYPSLDFVNSNREGMEFIGRLAYDLTFFVWVGILLFNVITGLIVDTFSRLREEDAKRIDVLANECFICGCVFFFPHVSY